MNGMTKFPVLWFLVASGLGVGCSGTASGNTGDGGSAADGGLLGDGGVSGPTPLLVAGPDAGGPVLQGGTHQLLWTGTQYAVLYQVNVGGRIPLRIRFVNAAGTSVSEPVEVTPSYESREHAPQSGKMAWANGELRVFWTTESQTIWMRRVDANGELLSDPTPAVQNVGVNAYLKTVVPRDDGFALLWLDDRSQEYLYLWYFVRIDDTGVELFPQALLTTDVEAADAGGGLVEHEGRYSLIWSFRQATMPDSVFLSSFDQDGVLSGPPPEIYRADHAMLSFFGPPAARWYGGELVAIWDLDRGVVLFDTTTSSAEDAPVVLGSDEVTGQPIVSASEAGGEDTIAVLYGAGEYGGSSLSPTELHFATVDALDWVVTYRVQLNAQTQTPGSCLQDRDVVSSSGGFGVTWVRGCSEADRTLFFTKVGPTGDARR